MRATWPSHSSVRFRRREDNSDGSRHISRSCSLVMRSSHCCVRETHKMLRMHWWWKLSRRRRSPCKGHQHSEAYSSTVITQALYNRRFTWSERSRLANTSWSDPKAREASDKRRKTSPAAAASPASPIPLNVPASLLCVTCNRQFKSVPGFRRYKCDRGHRATKSNRASYGVCCSHCNRQFCRQSDLSRHLRFCS